MLKAINSTLFKNTYIDLPKGWVWTELKEVVNKMPLTGKKLKQKEYQKSGEFPVIDQGQDFIGGYTDKEELKIICESPVVIFGDHTKVVSWLSQELC